MIGHVKVKRQLPTTDLTTETKEKLDCGTCIFNTTFLRCHRKFNRFLEPFVPSVPVHFQLATIYSLVIHRILGYLDILFFLRSFIFIHLHSSSFFVKILIQNPKHKTQLQAVKIVFLRSFCFNQTIKKNSFIKAPRQTDLLPCPPCPVRTRHDRCQNRE
jgi:hypothetical protein